MVHINGEDKDIAGINLYDYLINEGYELNKIVVERNLEIIDREAVSDVVIQDEDTIEVLRFVGGG